MAERDLYQVLGVSRDASPEDIKKAYRRLARSFHPDVNGGDPQAEQRFKEINLAYQTLSDPGRRRRYDTFGGEGFTPDMFGFMGDISDIFEAFFGSPLTTSRSRQRTRTRRGADLQVDLALAFEEAAFGVRKEVRIESLETCQRCAGNGAEPGTHPTRCTRCGGSGEVSEVRRSVFGTVMTSRACSTCEGTGQEIASPCRACGGDGRVPKEQEVQVEVPPGVADGMQLRVEGGGQGGRQGGSPGDLFLSVRVQPHPLFERRGQDLVGTLELPVPLALLGAEVEVETIHGPKVLKVPAGTRAGTVFRVLGGGLPHLGRRGRGDLYVQVDLFLPDRLTRRERALVEELADLQGVRPGRDAVPGRLRPRPEA
jgi:molecular chaperone DnaJ